ncbi:MAG TPA: hypothetical protein VGB78_10575 [Thermoplasmata archaeon]
MTMVEINRAVEASSLKLLQISVPPVRYCLLRQVLDRDENDISVQRTLKDCASYPAKLKLLGRMNQDGTWPISRNKQIAEEAGSGQPVGFTYRTMLWNLFMLSEYKAERSDGHVGASVEKMLGWQEDEGYIPGPWTDVIPVPYYNGYALYLMTRLGFQSDKRVGRLADWLLSIQRMDGGWNKPFVMDLHYTPEFRAMRMRDFLKFVEERGWRSFDLKGLTQYPSCAYTTMMVIWGLMQQPKVARSSAVRRGADFILDRFFKRNPHPSYYMSEEHWTRLTYPYRFGSGLMALDMLTELGYGPDDERMDRPIKWLLGARAADGMWSQSDRPHPERDQFITLIALRTLHRYSRKAK